MDNPYNDCKVYMLYVDGLDEVYIGSTTKTLEKRLRDHLSCYFNGYEYKCTSNKLFESGKVVKIKLLEDCCFNTRAELRECEKKHINKNENCVNIVIPGRTQQEYRETNRDIINQRQRERCAKKSSVYKINGASY